jgi:hypothetical protein
VPAPFTICPPESIGEDCTHVFTGVAPTTFEYAVPGDYEITWQSVGGFPTPPNEAATLTDGGTIQFHGSFGDVDLPFTDDFEDDLGWVVVDEGTIESPSDWVLTTDSGNGVFEQRSNIYSGTPDGEGPLDKLGTLVFNGDADWTDYSMTTRFRAFDDDSVGIIARYLNNDNYYRFSVDRQRTFARLVVRHGGTFTLLDSDSEYVGYTTSTWSWLRLVVDGNTIEAYVSSNGMSWDLLLSGTDSNVPRGGVGLYVWGVEGVQFDDVAVEGL